MAASGKILRLGRIFRRSSGKTVIVALDHGRRYGPIRGIEDFKRTVEILVDANIDAIMATPAMIERVCDVISGRIAAIARIDGTGTIKGPDPMDDRLIASVERGLKVGADAVSVMIYVGSEREADLLEKLGFVADLCFEYGMPLLAEMIPSKPFLKDPYDPANIAYCARIGAEYGADVIKTLYSGDPRSFKDVVSSVPVPIVILGGPRKESVADVLRMVHGAIEGGARGVAIGRNIFQSRNPELMAQIISEIVHEGLGLEEALKKAKEGKLS